MTRYDALAGLLEEQIDRGVLAAGERLRSVRELSATARLSPGTVVLAYELLRQRGRIESRERSGYFVCASATTPMPPEVRARPTVVHRPSPLDPDELALMLRQAAHDSRILPLGVATPSPEFLPHRAVARALQRALRDDPELLTDYRFPPGSTSLRREIVRRYSHFGVRAKDAAVVTTAGAIDAISLSLQVVAKPGDVIAIESPTYFGIVQMVRALGFGVVELPLTPGTGLQPEQLSRVIKKVGRRLKAAVIVANHSNPLGTTMPDDAKAELVAIASRSGVILVEDDIYGDLGFTQRPRPLKAFDRDESVILCSSFAKTISPSLRVGFTVSERYARAICALRSALASGVSAAAEEALAIYLASGGYERHLAHVRREYRMLLGNFTRELMKHLPAESRISQPSGGYVLWVQLPGDVDSRLVQERALARRISVASGVMFSGDGHYRDCLRLSCAVPLTPRTRRGIALLGKIVAECRGAHSADHVR